MSGVRGKRRRAALRALRAAFAVALFAEASVGHAAERTLRLGFILSEASQLGAGARVFSAEVARRLGGRYRIEVYPDAMLGGELAMWRDAQVGALDLVYITGAPLPSLVPAEGIFNIPFLFRNATQARQVLDGPIGDEYLAKLDSAGVVGLAWGENGMRDLTNSLRVVRTPDDLKGMKLRLPQSDLMTAGFKALGADVTQIPFNQLYGALKDGRVDAEENPIATIVSSHFAQVQKHLTLTAHVYDPAVFIMSHHVYDSLSPEDRRAFKEAARIAGEASRTYNIESERTGIAALRKDGMDVVEHIDRDAFKKRIAPAAAQWEKTYGKAEIERIASYTPDKPAKLGNTVGSGQP